MQIGELSQLAIKIGLWATKNSEKGLNELIQEEALLVEFDNVTLEQLRFAIAELEKDGFLATTHYLTESLPHMRMTTELYLAFDQLAVGSNPAVDVVDLVDLALKSSDSVTPERLLQATGWPLRRFNPAFAYMVSQIDDRRVLKGGTDEFEARGFLLVDSDRVDLHRFAKRLRGRTPQVSP